VLRKSAAKNKMNDSGSSSRSEVHEKRLDAVGEQITALRAAIADTDRRWQAYINTLPRQ
jgi:DNA-binding winged helix-turn-helix (wHTH) protein